MNIYIGFTKVITLFRLTKLYKKEEYGKSFLIRQFQMFNRLYFRFLQVLLQKTKKFMTICYRRKSIKKGESRLSKIILFIKGKINLNKLCRGSKIMKNNFYKQQRIQFLLINLLLIRQVLRFVNQLFKNVILCGVR